MLIKCMSSLVGRVFTRILFSFQVVNNWVVSNTYNQENLVSQNFSSTEKPLKT